MPPKAPQVAPREVLLSLSLGYLSGGPASGHPVKLTALVRNRDSHYPDYAEFTFGTGFDRDDDKDAEGRTQNAGDRLVVDRNALSLGPDGTARFVVKDLPKVDRPRELLAEMPYRDPNGEEQTLRGVAALWPAGVVAGIKTEGWVQVKKRAPVQVLVLGLDGRPRAGAAVTVKGRVKTTTSSRKRTVGGFYAYDNKTETRDLGTLCSGRSDARDLVFCDATLAVSGDVELEAQADDGTGNRASAQASLWVSGGESWFGGDNADRMDLLPEMKRYAPGETAKFQVRMPFRSATAWLAIEREGVIETRVVTVSGKDPVIELPILPGYAPNVYVSVLAVRGRVGDVPWYSFFQWGWRAPLE